MNHRMMLLPLYNGAAQAPIDSRVSTALPPLPTHSPVAKAMPTLARFSRKLKIGEAGLRSG